MPRWSQQRRFDEIFSVFQMRGMLWSERTYARHGLVFADPWSDRRIAEFALSLPQQIVDRPGEAGKRLVRAAMVGVMPEPARLQAKKTPPTALFEAAIRGPGQAAARDLLRATRLEDLGLVNGAELRSGFEHYLGAQERGGDIWRAMAAEWWLRTY
jgi:asparagine synthase (glutamine-hydrolysing)